MAQSEQGPWVQLQILADRDTPEPVLDIRAIHTWFLPRVHAYLKEGSRLLTRHWVGEPLGKGCRRALQNKVILP